MYVAKQHLKTPLKSGTNALQRCCFSILFYLYYPILLFPKGSLCFPMFSSLPFLKPLTTSCCPMISSWFLPGVLAPCDDCNWMRMPYSGDLLEKYWEKSVVFELDTNQGGWIEWILMVMGFNHLIF